MNRQRCNRLMGATDDIQSDPEVLDKVVDGLAADLAEPDRIIRCTRLQQIIVCEVGRPPRSTLMLEVVANEEDGGILEARDAHGTPLASAPDIDQLRDRLFGMTLPE